MISLEFPSTVTVPLAALAVVDTVPSRSPALKLMVWMPSSSTVAVDTTSSVGASLMSLTVTLTVLTTWAPSSSVVVTVIVSLPLVGIRCMVISPEFPSTVTVPLAALAVVDTVPSRSPALKLMVWDSPSSSTVAVDGDFQRRCIVDVADRHADGFDHLGAVVVGGGDGDGICSVEVGVRCVGDLAGVPSTVTVPLAVILAMV